MERDRALTSAKESAIIRSSRRRDHGRSPTRQDLKVKARLGGASRPTASSQAAGPVSVCPARSILDRGWIAHPCAAGDLPRDSSPATPQPLEILSSARIHRNCRAQPERIESLFVAQFLVQEALGVGRPVGASAFQADHPTGRITRPLGAILLPAMPHLCEGREEKDECPHPSRMAAPAMATVGCFRKLRASTSPRSCLPSRKTWDDRRQRLALRSGCFGSFWQFGVWSWQRRCGSLASDQMEVAEMKRTDRSLFGAVVGLLNLLGPSSRFGANWFLLAGGPGVGKHEVL